MQNICALLARFGLGAIFIYTGYSKFIDIAGTQAYMAGAGIPMAEILVWVSAFAEVLGGASLILGFLTRYAAAGLIIMLLPVTYFFHNPLVAPSQIIQTFKNFAIIGGLFMLLGFGPGAWSVDKK